MSETKEIELTVFTDGGSRGNPGESATGVVVMNGSGEVIWEEGKYIGQHTNNEAEYLALERALGWLGEFFDQKNSQSSQVSNVHFKLDSKLVVEQMKGSWKIKEPRMRELREKCVQLEKELPVKVSYKHIPRAENAQADALVNQALDTQKA